MGNLGDSPKEQRGLIRAHAGVIFKRGNILLVTWQEGTR